MGARKKKVSLEKGDSEQEWVELESECMKCCVWIPYKVPKQLPRGFNLVREFICGFCAAQEIKSLKEQVAELVKTQDNEVIGGKTYANVTAINVAQLSKQIRNEEKLHNERKNLVIVGTQS